MPGVQYKDRVIEAQSYKSDSGRWRPQALVSIHEGGTHLVPAPLERVFHTEADADAYAVEMAKRWIDDKGP